MFVLQIRRSYGVRRVAPGEQQDSPTVARKELGCTLCKLGCMSGDCRLSLAKLNQYLNRQSFLKNLGNLNENVNLLPTSESMNPWTSCSRKFSPEEIVSDSFSRPRTFRFWTTKTLAVHTIIDPHLRTVQLDEHGMRHVLFQLFHSGRLIQKPFDRSGGLCFKESAKNHRPPSSREILIASLIVQNWQQ